MRWFAALFLLNLDLPSRSTQVDWGLSSTGTSMPHGYWLKDVTSRQRKYVLFFSLSRRDIESRELTLKVQLGKTRSETPCPAPRHRHLGQWGEWTFQTPFASLHGLDTHLRMG
jgi:hypothetical protein